MTERANLVQQIGEHVVSSFERWTKNPKGTYLAVPNTIPLGKRTLKIDYPRLSDWFVTVEVKAPTLIMTAGPGDYIHLDLREALSMLDQTKRKKKKK